MKILKVQSISDIITNSSSEVFVMDLETAMDFYSDHDMTIIQSLEQLLESYSYYDEIFYNVLDIPYSVKMDDMAAYIHIHYDEMPVDRFPLAVVDICDHDYDDYDDFQITCDSAKDDSYTWYSNR